MKEKESDVRSVSIDPKICFLGNYPPKECGIATFTKDLVTSMNKAFNPKLRSRVIALNDSDSHYNYDKRVILNFPRDSPEHYINMAKIVNESPDYKLVCIQHEFGLYGGGDYGENILYFIENVKKPIVLTFHSVLPHPEERRRKIVRRISNSCSAIIVMAESAVEILNKDYGIERSKIFVIHHGTPNAKFVSSEHYKKKMKIEDKTVILTFGLLSRGKGIEYMIKSLPPLVKDNPNLLYIILGETHPDVRMNDGESYRNELMSLVKELGLEDNVKFHNKYVTTKELVEYLLTCDIYAFTNLEKEQITSGTLAYATACGRPVVATPIVYAEEILSQDRGIIISDFKKPEAFTEALNKLLSDSEYMKNMAEAAYAYGRQMIWSNVARRHLNVFNRIVKLREEVTKKYPAIKLEQLKNLTDNFGCIQFSKGSVPDKESGYTLDDNTRALIATVLYNNLGDSDLSFKLAKRYLKFLEHAQTSEGNFENVFLRKNKKIGESSEDAFGRAIWALGYTVNKATDKKIINKAEDLYDKSFPLISKLGSLRSKAFALKGLYYHYEKYGRKRDLILLKDFAESLLKSYEENSSGEWNWFEKSLTYANAKLSEAMFFAYMGTKDERYLRVAESSLNFLSEIVFIEDELHPIGQNGWFNKNGKRSFFDQQPIDVFSMVSAYITAYLATDKINYYENAVLAFNWFLGKNHLKQMVYDETTGGCYDGLGKHSLNLNQGAESTISYLLSRLFLEEIKNKESN